MRRIPFVPSAFLLIVAAGCSGAGTNGGPAPNVDDGVLTTANHDQGSIQGDADAMSVSWTREAHAAHGGGGGGGRSPLMTYHGGKILTTAVTQAIFWGPSWNNATFAGDKISGLDSWYAGISGSDYAKTVDEYSGSNGEVGSTTSYVGHVVDTSRAAGGGRTSTILAEVCKQITEGNIVPDPSGNGYYPVYTDVKRGNASYCAWHSWGTCGTTPVQFGFFFDLDGDPGCDPQDTTTTHSQGLAALANVTGHELSESRSDPGGNAWYDSSGSEDGDKCAWTFNVPSVTLSNGTSWKLQGEWSNAAYTAGTGYPNSSGQKGCLDGH